MIARESASGHMAKLLFSAAGLMLAAGILVAGAVLTSCSARRDVMTALNDVESYINERPDSALAVLGQISPASLSGRETNARYALLMSMAKDKNYIYETDDSLVRVALDFYENHGSSGNRAKAWYYLGRVQQNAGNPITAVVSFSMARNFADRADDPFYAGMACRALSEVYQDCFATSEEMKYATLSYEYFDRAGRQRHRNYALLDIATAQHNQYQFEECESTCRKVISIAEGNGDTVLLAEGLRQLAYAKAYSMQSSTGPEEAIQILSYVADSLQNGYRMRDIETLMEAYMKLNDFGAVRDIMSELDDRQMDDRMKGIIPDYKYRLALADGKYEAALRDLEESAAFQDSVFVSALNQTALSAQNEWLGEHAEYSDYRAKMRERIIILVSVMSGIIILLLVFILVKKVKDKNRELERYVGQVAEAVERINSSDALLVEKDRMIGDLSERLRNGTGMQEDMMDEFRDKIHGLYQLKFNLLSEMCSEYYSYNAEATRRKHVYDKAGEIVKILSTDDELDLLESIVNKYKCGIMGKLRMEFPNLKKDNMKLLCYCFAGFSPAAISLFMGDDNVSAVYNRKSRIKRKIENSTAEHKDLFVSELK